MYTDFDICTRAAVSLCIRREQVCCAGFDTMRSFRIREVWDHSQRICTRGHLNDHESVSVSPVNITSRTWLTLWFSIPVESYDSRVAEIEAPQGRKQGDLYKQVGQPSGCSSS